jgi:hypothetical protein
MFSEKSLPLPVTERLPSKPSRAPAPALSGTAWVRVTEATLLSLSLILAVVQFSAIYSFHYTTTPPSQSQFLRAWEQSPALLALARGLPLAMTSNLFAGIVFLIAAPYIAKEGTVGFVRGLAVFCYLAGSMWGGVVLGADLLASDHRA